MVTTEVEPIGQHDRLAAGSGRHGNEAVAGSTSEAFGRWLHRRYVLVKLPSSAGNIVLPRGIVDEAEC